MPQGEERPTGRSRPQGEADRRPGVRLGGLEGEGAKSEPYLVRSEAQGRVTACNGERKWSPTAALILEGEPPGGGRERAQPLGRAGEGLAGRLPHSTGRDGAAGHALCYAMRAA